REIRSMGGTSMILPTSYTLSPRSLNVGPDPFTSGGYSDVYHGTLDGAKICVKRVRALEKGGPQKAVKAMCREALIWKHLNHPNILPLLGVTVAPPQLISNLMPGGTLPQYIREHPDSDRLRLLYDVANGLHYLHSRGVIHGGIKGANILVDDSGHARIADFCEATIVKDGDSVEDDSDIPGHISRWTAPEVLNEETHSKKSDIFSFAMVMIEVRPG
ncbi:kinase-like protein, partial [Thelephora ganbajun]